jgi:hypothetical protein
MNTLQLYNECWVEVTKQKRYQDKWLSDETYYRAIKAQFPSLESLGFDRGRMNKAISTYGGTTLDDFTEKPITQRSISGVKRKATIPLAIQEGLYGDTMLQPQGE